MRSLFVRDEREAAVEQGGDRLAYIVVSYGCSSSSPSAPSWSSRRPGRDIDVVLHFDVLATGIDAGDTQACLKGTTSGGIGFYGCDQISPIP